MSEFKSLRHAVCQKENIFKIRFFKLYGLTSWSYNDRLLFDIITEDVMFETLDTHVETSEWV